jgi:hypothetical protein
MKLEGLLPSTQQSATGLYPEPIKYNLHTSSLRFILMVSFHLRLRLSESHPSYPP